MLRRWTVTGSTVLVAALVLIASHRQARAAARDSSSAARDGGAIVKVIHDLALPPYQPGKVIVDANDNGVPDEWEHPEFMETSHRRLSAMARSQKLESSPRRHLYATPPAVRTADSLIICVHPVAFRQVVQCRLYDEAGDVVAALPMENPEHVAAFASPRRIRGRARTYRLECVVGDQVLSRPVSLGARGE
jgi:hypothetical protein